LDYGAQISGSGDLTLAAERGNVDNVECLLGRGADVNEMVSLNTSRNGHENMGCPLHKAVENGHATVVDILLNAGADVSIRDAKGRTAADIAAQGGLGRGDELSS
jgi:ankyrin repeat protein